jgi:PIN domain nuclease of toxin-antitoxin system
LIEFVLDSSALLARIYREPGGDRVRTLLSRACMSAVNYAEVLSKLVEDGMPFSEADHLLDRLGFQILEADKHRSAMAGALQERTKRTAVSLGDRYCLQLAMELSVPALTTDRRWASLGLDVKVELIR